MPYLFLSPWPTRDLREHGLALAGHPRSCCRLPDAATTPPVTDLEIRQVTDETGLADAERVLIEGYPLPELQPFQPGALYNATFLGGPSTVWVGYDGDVPLATSTAHNAAGLTVVENVAVMPAARGRCAGAAVTWTATTHHPDPTRRPDSLRRRPTRLPTPQLPPPGTLDRLGPPLTHHRPPSARRTACR